MADIWKKLNLKDQSNVVVVDPPDAFDIHLNRLGNVTIHRSLARIKQIEFVIAFVSKRAMIAKVAKSISRKVTEDAVVWFAYPKQTSKNIRCDFNRDSGWEPMAELGFDGVRMVSIDADWSALRFRQKQFIKYTPGSKRQTTGTSDSKTTSTSIPKRTLNRIRKACMRLPDTVETETWGKPHFRVGKKIFAGVGVEEGVPSLGCKLTLGRAAALVKKKGFRPAKYNGRHGWVSVDLSEVSDGQLIEELIIESYRLIAPKRSLQKMND